MASVSISVTLTGEAAERLECLVQSGGYSSAEAALDDALAAFEDLSSPELDAWLDLAAARYDEYVADPTQVVSVEEVRRLLLR